MAMRRGLTTITVLLTLTGLLAAQVLAGGAKSGSQGSVFYLSVGTSLSVGVQPNPAGQNRRTQEGYPDQLYAALSQTRPKMRLVRLGCLDETTPARDSTTCTTAATAWFSGNRIAKRCHG